ncbi:unnamed protein product [Oncorhynchus mykiss]|uniref:Uncharacterized protein n=1 Tax=Oncorhynchus mykiss TaxID=8022 RepID=A0A060X080_ONCMY|nr:unnamed protein product [Oncorhynchus mykiss]
MCSRVWFVTDRRIHQEYPQVQILRALKQRCSEEDVEFRSLLMDQIVLTISEGQLGKSAGRAGGGDVLPSGGGGASPHPLGAVGQRHHSATPPGKDGLPAGQPAPGHPQLRQQVLDLPGAGRPWGPTP